MKEKEFFQAIWTLIESGRAQLGNTTIIERAKTTVFQQGGLDAESLLWTVDPTTGKVTETAKAPGVNTQEKFNEKNVVPGIQITTFNSWGIRVKIGFFYMYETEEKRQAALKRQRLQLGSQDRFLADFVEIPPTEKQLPGTAYMFHAPIAFSLTPYPACCGLKIFHHFTCAYKFDEKQQELFNNMMVYLLKYIHRKHFSLYASRLEAVFVSMRRKKPAAGRKSEPELEENTEFVYQPFRTFFQQRAVKIQKHVFYNYNSGSMLEKSEALFDSHMFPMI